MSTLVWRRQIIFKSLVAEHERECRESDNGTIGGDVKPARTVVLQSLSTTACVHCNKAVSGNLTVLTNRPEVI